jgi:hypothetical protein
VQERIQRTITERRKAEPSRMELRQELHWTNYRARFKERIKRKLE